MKHFPINVLHVIDSLAVGGAERVLVDLANATDRSVALPSVCVTRSGDITLAKDLREDVLLYQLPRTKTWDLASLRQFVQIINEQRIDVIHAHGYSSSHFVSAAKVYGRIHTPLIMHAHSSEPPGLVTRLVARRTVQYFIGVSSEIVAWSQSLMGLSNSMLLGNAVNLERYVDVLPAHVSRYFDWCPRFIAVVVANVRPVKDFETLFTAVAHSAYREELGILIAGSTDDEMYLKRCRSLLEALDMSERVIFLGGRQDVPSLLAAADIGLLSSRRESGPLALLEFMAAGLPFVVTKVGQIGEAVAVAGLPEAVPILDTQSFTAAIDALLALSPDERRKRGAAGQHFLLGRFTRKTQIERLQALYCSL